MFPQLVRDIICDFAVNVGPAITVEGIKSDGYHMIGPADDNGDSFWAYKNIEWRRKRIVILNRHDPSPHKIYAGMIWDRCAYDEATGNLVIGAQYLSSYTSKGEMLRLALDSSISENLNGLWPLYEANAELSRLVVKVKAQYSPIFVLTSTSTKYDMPCVYYLPLRDVFDRTSFRLSLQIFQQPASPIFVVTIKEGWNTAPDVVKLVPECLTPIAGMKASRDGRWLAIIRCQVLRTLPGGSRSYETRYSEAYEEKARALDLYMLFSDGVHRRIYSYPDIGYVRDDMFFSRDSRWFYFTTTDSFLRVLLVTNDVVQ